MIFLQHSFFSYTASHRYSGDNCSGNDHIEDKLSEKTAALGEIELGLFTGFDDTTALEDKKGLTVFSAKPVVDYNY